MRRQRSAFVNPDGTKGCREMGGRIRCKGARDARAGGDTSLAADNATLIFGLKLAGPSFDVTPKDKNPGEFDSLAVGSHFFVLRACGHIRAQISGD